MSNLKLPLLQQEKEEKQDSSWLLVLVVFVVVIDAGIYVSQLHSKIKELKTQIKLQSITKQTRKKNALHTLTITGFFPCLTRYS